MFEELHYWGFSREFLASGLLEVITIACACRSGFMSGNCKLVSCGSDETLIALSAHLLRELQSLIEIQSQLAISFKAFLLETYNKPFEQRLGNRAAIEQQYDILLEQAHTEEPQPIRNGSKGRPKQTKGRNLLERLQKFKPAVLAFAFNAEVPFTNNQAERDIRPIKVKQKISDCFRTFKGAEHYSRICMLQIYYS